MITDNDKKILDAFYEPVPMGRNDDAVLRKVMNAVKAAAPELFELRYDNKRLREEAKEAQIVFDATWSEADLLRIENKEQRREIEKLREALKETLAIASRNEAGDYVDRARAALEGVTEKEGLRNE